MPIRERRRNERQAIKHDVVLCCGHLGLVRGKASNISTNGMFVKTGRVTLDVNSRVEICFGVGTQGRRQFHRLAARVVRIDKCGLGLQFIKSQPNTVSVFTEGAGQRLAS